MKTVSFVAAAGIGLALAGCGHKAPAPEISAGPAAGTNLPRVADWRQVATDDDRDRIRGWRNSWTAAVAKARAGGRGPAIDALGLLADPDRALDEPTPPPGAYRCRTYKIGANGTAMADFTSYPATECHIENEGEVSSLYNVGGAQRPVGLIFPDTVARAVFLGTLVLGDETKSLQYGKDPRRDMAGYVERIGERRWRLVLPSPRFESLLDIVEITPAR
ncbi:DUF4893 domain-containing protein [Sphingomonas immobilis]|uniref:DUF4893 domain-containing protein n=1 Tax=Sphingomonas immobilis TaxID=3063997 RepID=A0ABT8ZWG6_9SPHN|nr:DUF4893 domain-containing protein [Sphingomonas sp. CA1-15]MDO7840817.1 DUF4893 domain-containing protein [Sphingomonas sp. CA1-15]